MKNEKKKTKTVDEKDPIVVAKRKLDEARADYKRVKEINAGPNEAQPADQERDEIRKEIVGIKEKRMVLADHIKAALPAIKDLRIKAKDVSR